jgi:hypothetical protein
MTDSQYNILLENAEDTLGELEAVKGELNSSQALMYGAMTAIVNAERIDELERKVGGIAAPPQKQQENAGEASPSFWGGESMTGAALMAVNEAMMAYSEDKIAYAGQKSEQNEKLVEGGLNNVLGGVSEFVGLLWRGASTETERRVIQEWAEGLRALYP